MAAKEITIDAGGKKLGRVASTAARALLGKTSASYTPHIDSEVRVVITNAGKLHMPDKKRLQKKYVNYSGFPGGIKTESLSSLIARKGAGEALRRAISRMLPRNATRTARLKRLSIND